MRIWIGLVIGAMALAGLLALGYVAVDDYLQQKNPKISADCQLVAETLSPPGSANQPDLSTASPEELADYEPSGLSFEEILANADKLEDHRLRQHLEDMVAASDVVLKGMPKADGENLNPPGLKEYFVAQQQLRESISAIKAACPNM